MQITDVTATLDFFNAPSPAELEAWCKANNYYGVTPTQDTPGEGCPSDHILAAALWWAQTNHPDADKVGICSFAGMVAYFATGWHGGFGTDWYQKEPRAESIVVALAGGAQLAEEGFYSVPKDVAEGAPAAEFTERVLEFLAEFYFVDEQQAVAKLMAQNAIAMIRAGEVLTASQVADECKLAKRNVTEACTDGRLTSREATKTPTGWLITSAGAERVWGSRK